MQVSERKGAEMDRKLIIDGNAVYEIDEECIMQRRKQLEEMERQKKAGTKNQQQK